MKNKTNSNRRLTSYNPAEEGIAASRADASAARDAELLEELEAKLAGALERNRKEAANAIAPAHLAEGQECAQCGKAAWRVELIPFCLDHDQETMRLALDIEELSA